MRMIALTSADESAMQAVAMQLLHAATARSLALGVLIGIKTRQEADALYSQGGELWRIGHETGRPELDTLVDRALDATTPGRLVGEVDQALAHFLGKRRVAA